MFSLSHTGPVYAAALQGWVLTNCPAAKNKKKGLQRQDESLKRASYHVAKSHKYRNDGDNREKKTLNISLVTLGVQHAIAQSRVRE